MVRLNGIVFFFLLSFCFARVEVFAVPFLSEEGGDRSAGRTYEFSASHRFAHDGNFKIVVKNPKRKVRGIQAARYFITTDSRRIIILNGVRINDCLPKGAGIFSCLSACDRDRGPPVPVHC